MKITRINLENIIKEEVEKLVSELESTTLRLGPVRAPENPGAPKTAGRPLAAAGHIDALEEIIARLSRIEGKIDELGGGAPMSTAS